MKKVLVTGILGQDGSYLAEHLLAKGYKVYGLHRRTSQTNTQRIQHILSDINLVEGDITDSGNMMNIISRLKPDYIYNLAAQSHVASSFHQPSYTTNATYLGCLNLLEAIRILNPRTRFYQASSSEMFGKNFSYIGGEKLQDESTEFVPQSPYAIAKLAAHHAVRLYRDSYGIFACSGILFNHESPRRGELFVTRKITKWIGEYKAWLQRWKIEKPFFDDGYIYDGEVGSNRFPKLKLGNLFACRDWGHAKDYTRAMIMMLEHNKADDYIVSMEETHSIHEFLEKAFSCARLSEWKEYVDIDVNLMRPAEVEYLCGKSTKIRLSLGWKPEYNFSSLVKEMVDHDIRECSNGSRIWH